MPLDFQTVISSPTAAYDEGLEFFAGKGMINRTLKRIAADLDEHGIDYTLIGAVALNSAWLQTLHRRHCLVND